MKGGPSAMSLIKVSEKKREANARNAQHSTGPRTAEGRERSSRNAIRHGCASSLVHKPIHGEPADHFSTTLERLMTAWAPVDDKEAQLVQAIAISWIRIERSERWEASILSSVMDTRARKVSEFLVKQGREPRSEFDPDLGACIAMVDDRASGPNMWKENQRHSTKAWREWQKAVDTLRKMQDKRFAKSKDLAESADMGLNGTGAMAQAAGAGHSPASAATLATIDTQSQSTHTNAPDAVAAAPVPPCRTTASEPQATEFTADMGPNCNTNITGMQTESPVAGTGYPSRACSPAHLDDTLTERR